MVSSELFKIEWSEDGLTSLEIPETYFEDAGVYTMHASNSHGVVEASAILTVEGNVVLRFNILICLHVFLY